MKYKSYTRNALRRLKAARLESQQAIGPMLVGAVQNAISTLYPPASLSGFPPHYRSGDLSRSYSWSIISEKLIVGSNSIVAIWLEMGTIRMGARPHFLATLTIKMPDAQLIINAVYGRYFP